MDNINIRKQRDYDSEFKKELNNINVVNPDFNKICLLVRAMQPARTQSVPLLTDINIINVQTDIGNTVLLLASINNNLEIVSYLVEHNADVNIKNMYGDTALIWASKNNNLDMVTYLVEHDATINIKNYISGNTALIFASSNNNLEMVICLVKHGADINIKNIEGNTALLLASINNNIEMVTYLVEHMTKK